MMFGIETTMGAITDDSKKGITDRFRSLPMSSVAVPFGRAGADLVNSAVQLGVLMVGGLLVGWRIDGSARRRGARGGAAAVAAVRDAVARDLPRALPSAARAR